MKKIKKCIIPVAGFGTRFLPATKSLPKEMFPIVDKPVLQYLVQEAIESWCEDVIIITWRNKRAIEDHFDSNYELEKLLEKKWKFRELDEVKKLNSMANIIYIRQPYPRGDGEAILRARNIIWNEAFVCLNGDELVFNKKQSSCKQLIEAYLESNSTVVWTCEVQDNEVSSYGILEAEETWKTLFKIKNFLEKPKSYETKSRSSSVWKYVLTPDIFDYLETLNCNKKSWEIRIADVIRMISEKKNVYWLKLDWFRFDTWSKIWLLKANIFVSLWREDLRDELKDFLNTL